MFGAFVVKKWHFPPESPEFRRKVAEFRPEFPEFRFLNLNSPSVRKMRFSAEFRPEFRFRWSAGFVKKNEKVNPGCDYQADLPTMEHCMLALTLNWRLMQSRMHMATLRIWQIDIRLWHHARAGSFNAVNLFSLASSWNSKLCQRPAIVVVAPLEALPRGPGFDPPRGRISALGLKKLPRLSHVQSTVEPGLTHKATGPRVRVRQGCEKVILPLKQYRGGGLTRR